MAKMHARPILFANGICSCHTIGIGSSRITTSRATSSAPKTISELRRFPHVPGVSRSQNLGNGLQMVRIMRIVPSAQSTASAVVV
jgi:hypothetical protein